MPGFGVKEGWQNLEQLIIEIVGALHALATENAGISAAIHDPQLQYYKLRKINKTHH